MPCLRAHLSAMTRDALCVGLTLALAALPEVAGAHVTLVLSEVRHLRAHCNTHIHMKTR